MFTLVAGRARWPSRLASESVEFCRPCSRLEAFAILSALGWGQPHSIGHYIDLGATVLAVTFIVVGVIVAAR